MAMGTGQASLARPPVTEWPWWSWYSYLCWVEGILLSYSSIFSENHGFQDLLIFPLYGTGTELRAPCMTGNVDTTKLHPQPFLFVFLRQGHAELPRLDSDLWSSCLNLLGFWHTELWVIYKASSSACPWVYIKIIWEAIKKSIDALVTVLRIQILVYLEWTKQFIVSLKRNKRNFWAKACPQPELRTIAIEQVLANFCEGSGSKYFMLCRVAVLQILSSASAEWRGP